MGNVILGATSIMGAAAQTTWGIPVAVDAGGQVEFKSIPLLKGINSTRPVDIVAGRLGLRKTPIKDGHEAYSGTLVAPWRCRSMLDMLIAHAFGGYTLTQADAGPPITNLAEHILGSLPSKFSTLVAAVRDETATLVDVYEFDGFVPKKMVFELTDPLALVSIDFLARDVITSSTTNTVTQINLLTMADAAAYRGYFSFKDLGAGTGVRINAQGGIALASGDEIEVRRGVKVTLEWPYEAVFNSKEGGRIGFPYVNGKAPLVKVELQLTKLAAATWKDAFDAQTLYKMDINGKSPNQIQSTFYYEYYFAFNNLRLVTPPPDSIGGPGQLGMALQFEAADTEGAAAATGFTAVANDYFASDFKEEMRLVTQTENTTDFIS